MLLRAAILAAFFLAAFWFRPFPLAFKQSVPYYAGFLIVVPAGAAIGLWLLLGMPGLRAALRDGRRWWIGLALSLTFWAVLSPVWSRYPAVSMDSAQQFAVVMAFALVVLCAGPSPRAAAAALAAGLIISAAVIIGQFYAQGSLGLAALGEFTLSPERRAISVVAAGPVRLLRPYGLSVHPNVAAGCLVAALLALSGWLADRDTTIWRWIVRAGVGLLGVWAVWLTFSRSAWAALAGGALLVGAAWLRRGVARPARGRVALALGGVALTAGLFVAAYPDLVLARAGVGGEEVELISVEARRIFIDIAFQIAPRRPITGAGIGAFAWEARDVLAGSPLRTLIRAENVHSTPLLALTELGIVGFGLWAGTLLIGFGLAWRRARDPFAAGLAAGAAALIAISVIDHYPWTMFPVGLLLWGSLALAIGSAPANDPNDAQEQAEGEGGRVQGQGDAQGQVRAVGDG